MGRSALSRSRSRVFSVASAFAGRALYCLSATFEQLDKADAFGHAAASGEISVQFGRNRGGRRGLDRVETVCTWGPNPLKRKSRIRVRFAGKACRINERV